MLQGFDIPQYGPHGPHCAERPSGRGGSGGDRQSRGDYLRQLVGEPSGKVLEADRLERYGDILEGLHPRGGSEGGAAGLKDSHAEFRPGVGSSHSWVSGWWEWAHSLVPGGRPGQPTQESHPKAGDPGPGQGQDSPSYCQRWEDMVRSLVVLYYVLYASVQTFIYITQVGEVNLFFEWALVNRLNKVEWLLLGE